MRTNDNTELINALDIPVEMKDFLKFFDSANNHLKIYLTRRVTRLQEGLIQDFPEHFPNHEKPETSTPNEIKDWLSVSEAARELGLSASGIQKRIRLGQLEAYRTSLGYLIDPSVINEIKATKNTVTDQRRRLSDIEHKRISQMRTKKRHSQTA